MSNDTRNLHNQKLEIILIVIAIFGFLISTIANSYIIIPPLGTLYFESETGGFFYTTYMHYLSIKIYGYIAIAGYLILAIGLFGFFLKFHKSLFFLSSLFSFISVLLRAYWILNFCPDWSVIGSGFKVEMLDIFEFNLGLCAIVESISILLFVLGISTTQGVTRNIRIISFLCTILPLIPLLQLIGLLTSLISFQTFLGLGLFFFLPLTSLTIAFATLIGFFISIRTVSLDIYLITGLSEKLDIRRKKILKAYSIFLLLWTFLILYGNVPLPLPYPYYLQYFIGMYNIILSIIGFLALSIFIF